MIGKHISRFEMLSSTSKYVAKQLKAGQYDEGGVILAHFQTEGRGQREKIWQSDAGRNLLFSFALRTDGLPLRQHFMMSKALAVSVLFFLKDQGVSDVAIKWPNDILVSGKKISGILLENIRIDKERFTVFGLGLNINQLHFSSDLNATSLALELGKDLNMDDLLENLINQINRYLLPVLAGNFENIDQLYLQYLYGTDDWINFKNANGSFTAKIAGVDSEGVLLVKSKQGHLEKFRNGEISTIY